MTRFFILATAAVGLGAVAVANPTLAQSSNHPERSTAQQLVDGAAQTVPKIAADHRFETALKDAKGVFIMPTLVKGAVVVGAEGAQGVLLKHLSDGSWSNPAFLTIGSVSFGAQAGGKAGPAAMLLMTDKALNDFTQANNFSINANAGLTVAGYSAQGQAPVGKGDIILWSDQSGAFAGASVSGADLTQNSAQDRAYYDQQVDAKQILDGHVTNAHAHKLRTELPT